MIATTYRDLIAAYRITADINLLPIIADAMEDDGVDGDVVLYGCEFISLRMLMRNVVVFRDIVYEWYVPGVPEPCVDANRIWNNACIYDENGLAVSSNSPMSGADIVPSYCVRSLDGSNPANGITYIVVPRHNIYVEQQRSDALAVIQVQRKLCDWLLSYLDVL